MNKKIVYCLITLLIILLLCSFIIIQKKNAIITSLNTKISELDDEIYNLTSPKVTWEKDGFNYLAIGNSITIHPLTSFWWSECGMAATKPENDYFHLVTNYLENNNANVVSHPLLLVEWETNYFDRDEQLLKLDQYLNDRLDLITIQLGENATNLTNFQEDYESMITYIKAKAPNAQVIVLGDYTGLFKDEKREEMKINACKNTSTEYISLDDMASDDLFKAGLNTTVYDQDGNSHIIEHEGVANHPGDKGMQEIANKIINKIK